MCTRVVRLSKDEQISLLLPMPQFLCDSDKSIIKFYLKKITTKINSYKVVCEEKKREMKDYKYLPSTST